MNPNWLLRMSQWARHPPSPKKILVVFGAVALMLIIFGLEHFGYWPDALTADRMRR